MASTKQKPGKLGPSPLDLWFTLAITAAVVGLAVPSSLLEEILQTQKLDLALSGLALIVLILFETVASKGGRTTPLGAFLEQWFRK